MFELDLLVSIGFMSLLFLRHINIYKERNKINYAPIVLGVGAVCALLHFVLLGDMEGWLLALREALVILSVGIVLSAIMNVMSQTQSAANDQDSRHRILALADDMEILKHNTEQMGERIGIVAQMESSTHEQLRGVLKEEIDALNMIQSNQKLFVGKIEALLAQQQISMERFEEFTLSELPGLDNVVHRHIDMLRIAEQDHFNQLKQAHRSAVDEKKELHGELVQIKELLTQIHHSQAPEHTVTILEKELDRILYDFGRHIQTLGAKSEGIVTSLLEHDALLKGLREQSELIMQQMVLSAKQMREMTQNGKELHESVKPLGALFASADTLHKEFLSAKGKLSELVVTLESYEKQEHRALRESLDRIANEVIAQIQSLSESLPRQLPSAEVSAKNVQELASKVKMQRSYSGESLE